MSPAPHPATSYLAHLAVRREAIRVIHPVWMRAVPLPHSAVDRLRRLDPRLAARTDRLVQARLALPSLEEPDTGEPDALAGLLAEPSAIINDACLILGVADAIRRHGAVLLAADYGALADAGGPGIAAAAVAISTDLPDVGEAIRPDPPHPDRASLLSLGRGLLVQWAQQRFGPASRWLTLRFAESAPGVPAPRLDHAVDRALAQARRMQQS